MATIINTPPSSDNSSGPIGIVIALVLLLVLVYLGVVYGAPALRRMQSGNVQINVPSQINVPNQIDVNVHQTN